MRFTWRPPPSRTSPVRCSTVTPGKLATFWRMPVRRLKRVDFPEFGGPTIATVRVPAGGREDGSETADGLRPCPEYSLMGWPINQTQTVDAERGAWLSRAAKPLRSRRHDTHEGHHLALSGPLSHGCPAENPVPSAAWPRRPEDRGGPVCRAPLLEVRAGNVGTC